MKKYVIGIDYGTLSGRAALIDAENGCELAHSILEYPHGVMEESLPDGTPLPDGFALQHPDDYVAVLERTIPDVIKKAGLTPEDIVGIGVDFTSCTLLPLGRDMRPLCKDPAFASEPNAYVKLWKHTSPQAEADEINRIASSRGEEWLKIYGGKLSSQFALPKILETLRRAPRVYEATERFIEAGDWISYLLTGEETHTASFAGYKESWNAETGYPSDDFMRALDPALAGIVGSKLSEKILPVSAIAGRVDPEGSRLTTLKEGTPVALPLIDAHAPMPVLKVTGEGEMMLILGTSACHILNSSKGTPVEGICGYAKDSVIPGYYTYEAGQAASGDIFDWFVKSSVPASYEKEAAERGISVHKLLREKAIKLKPGESGLLALDWVGGNRSVLVNSDLKGMIVGLTLRTRPEEIYRAWIEATAFGTKMIVENYEKNGIPVQKICASGGIAVKDEMMMQIYADVLETDIRVANTTQAGALGSAAYATVAAGIYKDIKEAAEHLATPDKCTYTPIPENSRIYRKLYEEYKTLHDYFGRGGNDIMKNLGKNE